MSSAGSRATERRPGVEGYGGPRRRTAIRRGRLLLSVVLSLIALTVGSVGVAAAAHSPTILTPLAGSAINNSTPTLSGVVGEEGEDETLAIFSGTGAEGPKVQETQPVEFPGQLWQFVPAALPDGTYTAQVSEEGGGTAEVTFTVDTTPPAVALTFPGNGSATTTGSQLLEGTAGIAQGDLPTIAVQLFAGSTIEAQAPLEALTVPVSPQGAWSGTFGGLSAGTYTARAQQSDSAGNVGVSAPVTFTVKPSPAGAGTPPAASFKWFPAVPNTGENVTLVSSSTDAFSPITSFAWSLTSGGPFRVGKPVLTTSFSTPGAHVVQLRVTDGNGLSSIASETIPVKSSPLILMQPFPIVRIAGSETRSGVRLSLLSAQAPAGARVTVSCKGHGCPARSESRVALSSRRRAGTVVVEFRRFERGLQDGTVLEIRISKVGQIGKYTRFVVRRRRLPQRVDMCLGPAGGNPLVCPSS